MAYTVLSGNFGLMTITIHIAGLYSNHLGKALVCNVLLVMVTPVYHFPYWLRIIHIEVWFSFSTIIIIIIIIIIILYSLKT